MGIKENLAEIKSELPKHVTLVAVSKTKPVELIKEAYEAGQRDFGENYAQELAEKELQLPKDIKWHAIGHLQTNKVKYIAPFVYLIHAVDSLKLLEEINKQAYKNNRKIDCLLQIYIAKEETKFGFSIEECEELFQSEEFKNLRHIRVVGLMGMASN
ncbi:MAG: YggS family pyridoxal phosphate-dependent enzyme, partial [Candidatus Paceibacterales bacterium]